MLTNNQLRNEEYCVGKEVRNVLTSITNGSIDNPLLYPEYLKEKLEYCIRIIDVLKERKSNDS